MELNPEKSFIIFSTAKRQNYTFQNPDRHWPFLLPRFRLLFAATVPLLFSFGAGAPQLWWIPKKSKVVYTMLLLLFFSLENF